MEKSTLADPREAEHLTEIADIVADLLSTTPERAAAAEDLLADFGIDSLVLIELFIRLERRYAVSISEDNITAVTSLRSVYEIVAERAGWLA
ncbi:acyl carrier protein [Amycolatopsis magusensis]|uniref:acyl carrier protein n=1 Tax=Amycolatopsis magusensis TaxID=882444 RepID=UPI00379AEFFB